MCHSSTYMKHHTYAFRHTITKYFYNNTHTQIHILIFYIYTLTVYFFIGKHFGNYMNVFYLFEEDVLNMKKKI